MRKEKKIEKLSDENLNVSGGNLYVVPDVEFDEWRGREKCKKDGRFKLVGEDINGKTYNLENLTRTKLKRELAKLDDADTVEYINVDEI